MPHILNCLPLSSFCFSLQPNKHHNFAQMEALIVRIDKADARLKAIEQKVNDPVARVERDLVLKYVYNFSFLTVSPNYYEFTLAERASILNCNVPQLCKSIIFENTMCDHNNIDDPTNSRFYCVIIQYISK